MTNTAAANRDHQFDSIAFLATVGKDRTAVVCCKKQIIFSQGDTATALFYIREGRVQLTVVSDAGKEAIIGMLAEGDFLGEGCLANQPQRMVTATTVTQCILMRIDKNAMVQVLRREQAVLDMFMIYLLRRNIKYEEEVVDHLFNSCEKRLARALLLLAQFGREGHSQIELPPISQETLAEMIGATRQRVSFFMNKFRKQGFVNYEGRTGLKVYGSLLNTLLSN